MNTSDMENVKFNLKQLVNQIVGIYSPQAKNKGFELILSVHRTVPETLIGNPTRVQKILMNVINNAILGAQKGQIMVLITVEEEMHSWAMIRLTVSFNGIIVDLNHPELSSSRQIIELKGGQFQIETKPGVGTNLWFTIFLKKPKPFIHEEFKKKIRILVVEDNEIPRNLTLEILNSSGYRSVDAAFSGVEALKKLNSSYYDLVLMDVEMSEMGGIETTKQIRKYSSSGKDLVSSLPHSSFLKRNCDVPIIAISANVEEEDQKQCLAAGMNIFIPKPIHSKKVLECIENLLFSPLLSSPSSQMSVVEDRGDTAKNDIFNWETSLEQIGGNSELLVQLINLFIKDFPDRLEKLKHALTENDPREIKVLAHSIKGNASMFKAQKISKIAYQIEIASKEGDLDTAQNLLADIEREFEQFRQAVKNHINK